jgi:hypothetical protein
VERNIERLVEAEHDGGQEFRNLNGWRWDKFRDVIPYGKLPNKEAKEKDRESVRKYRHRAALAGFRIVLA